MAKSKNRNKLAVGGLSPAKVKDGIITLSDDLEILARNNDELYDSTQKANLLPNVVGLNRRFLYNISQLRNCGKADHNHCESAEIGIGTLNKVGRDIVLEREKVSLVWDGARLRNSNNFMEFHESDDCYLMVTTYVPPNFRDLYFDDNSVLVAQTRHVPSPVTLDKNSLLGRIGDEVQSIDRNELMQILGNESIGLALETLTRMLGLQTSYLDLEATDAQVSAPAIHCKPVYTNSNKHPKPKRGTIIFNAEENRFEGYDGKRWRGLRWLE